MNAALKQLRDRLAELADLASVGMLLEWDQMVTEPFLRYVAPLAKMQPSSSE